VFVFDAQACEQPEEEPCTGRARAFGDAQDDNSAPIQKQGSNEFMER